MLLGYQLYYIWETLKWNGSKDVVHSFQLRLYVRGMTLIAVKMGTQC